MQDEVQVYPVASKESKAQREKLATEMLEAFRTFSHKVFAEGALTAKTKQLIALAVAHVTQCPYCIRSHTKGAVERGSTPEEIMEAIWIAAEMRAGAAYAHSIIAMDELTHLQAMAPAKP